VEHVNVKSFVNEAPEALVAFLVDGELNVKINILTSKKFQRKKTALTKIGTKSSDYLTKPGPGLA
jgi:hypothetical protein